MISPENSRYTGTIHADGKFSGEREDRVASTTVKKPVKSLDTLVQALGKGFPGKLIMQCLMNCEESEAFLPVAWRDYPNEPLQLSEAIERLPAGLRARLLRIQQSGLEAEFHSGGHSLKRR